MELERVFRRRHRDGAFYGTFPKRLLVRWGLDGEERIIVSFMEIGPRRALVTVRGGGQG